MVRRAPFRALAAASAFWLALLPGGVAVAQALILDVVGTGFRIVRGDGSVLTSHDLSGAVLNLSDGRKLRIDAVEADPEDREGNVLLHTFSVQGPDGRWSNPCEPGPDDRRQGFPLAGRSLPNGHIEPVPGAFEIVCTSGAQGKCVRFGYKPWKPTADGGSLRDHHHACVHMVRADYCGDGTATTREGTAIDIFDPLGIQRSDHAATMSFEAGWSPAGAVCLAHVRIPENMSLARIRQSCPRLAEARLGPACTEAAAVAVGALVLNRSVRSLAASPSANP